MAMPLRLAAVDYQYCVKTDANVIRSADLGETCGQTPALVSYTAFYDVLDGDIGALISVTRSN